MRVWVGVRVCVRVCVSECIWVRVCVTVFDYFVGTGDRGRVRTYVRRILRQASCQFRWFLAFHNEFRRAIGILTALGTGRTVRMRTAGMDVTGI
jgi:hypothetical protein